MNKITARIERLEQIRVSADPFVGLADLYFGDYDQSRLLSLAAQRGHELIELELGPGVYSDSGKTALIADPVVLEQIERVYGAGDL